MVGWLGPRHGGCLGHNEINVEAIYGDHQNTSKLKLSEDMCK